MEIKVEKPKFEPIFQAEIYRARRDGAEEYRVVIGIAGTEVPQKVGEFLDYHAISDFDNRKGIEAWILKQVRELEKAGKRIVVDESHSYLISRGIEELAYKSQLRQELQLF